MRVLFLILLCLPMTQSLAGDAPTKPEFSYKYSDPDSKAPKERLVVYYFGYTNCGPCKKPKNIEAVKTIKENLGKAYPKLIANFTMVCQDVNWDKAARFIKPYGAWDEIHLGNDWFSEFHLSVLSEARDRTLPHIMVYRDTVVWSKERGSHAVNRRLVADLNGTAAFLRWIKQGYPFKDPND